MLKITGDPKTLKAIAQTFSRAKGITMELTEDNGSAKSSAGDKKKIKELEGEVEDLQSDVDELHEQLDEGSGSDEAPDKAKKKKGK